MRAGFPALLSTQAAQLERKMNGVREQLQATGPCGCRPIERTEAVHQKFGLNLLDPYPGLKLPEVIDNKGWSYETDLRMPYRKLVKIGETTPLPTISQFLSEMAQRQHEEIQRLKSEALAGKLPNSTVPEEHLDELTPDPWQLHPVRIKKAPKKATKKRVASKRKVARTSKSKRSLKPLAKKSSRSSAKKVSKKISGRRSLR
jgi:hypothetical protein